MPTPDPEERGSGLVGGGVSLWRIATDTPDYQAHDLSGLGASRNGGRWNRHTVAMVYSSTSRALACLETLVRLDRGDALPLNRYLVELIVPLSAWQTRAVFDAAANVGWEATPEGQVSLDWGTRWASSGRSLLAEVPSVMVPAETNVLLNPLHPDAAMVGATKVRRWMYDPRLGDGRTAEG